MAAFLSTLLAPFQDVENALYALLVERQIGTAAGDNLEIIGNLVGQARNGVTDDEDYRRYIRARIATNRSSGLIEQLLNVARLVLDDTGATITVKNSGVAAVRMRVAGNPVTPTVADIAISFLRLAKAAGVRLVFDSSTAQPENTFSFLGGAGPGYGATGRLNLAPLTTNCQTVVRLKASGTAGNSVSLGFVHDAGAPAAGVLSSVGNAHTFTFRGATTTVAQFEAAITASAAMRVQTVDGVGTLQIVDAYGDALFTGGIDGGVYAGRRI